MRYRHAVGFTSCLLGILFIYQSSSAHLSAQDSPSAYPTATRYWDPQTPMDPAVPTPRQHFGFEIGHRHLDHAQVVDYIRKVVEASDRMTVRTYATSHGGRPLLMVTATSLENRKRLNKIKAAHRKLTKSGADDVDLESLPAIINMGYGVHGDESSATNCAPLVVYYLAAAQTPEVESWLENCVILIDPSLNPDGFNRFANWANRYRGAIVNPDPQHAEHNQMWPPGRVNYYWFDLNRDWLPAVHPESKGRLRNFHAWKPNVVLDFHEMGTGSTYFFQPGIPERTNPLTPIKNQRLTREFSRYHAKKLDQRGKLFFTQERFDDFYMGKGSTYPDLHGSVGILFEQASSRGHVQSTADGLLKFHDTIANQFTTSLTSLQATTAMRTELLEYKKQFYREAIELADRYPMKSFVFTVANNSTRLDRFAELLMRHDIQCYRLKQDLTYGDRTFKASQSLVVPAQQAEHRFLRSLLMRRKTFRENIFYDVSSWTLPLAYGVNQTGLKNSIDLEKLDPVEMDRGRVVSAKPKAKVSLDNPAVSYLIDFRDDAAVNVLVRLLRAGVKVRVAMKPVEVKLGKGTKKFPRGTLSVVLANQQNKVGQIKNILSSDLANSVDITQVASGLSVAGPDIGSPNFPMIKPPKLAMLTGKSVSAYGAGEVWHLLDREMAMPLTLLKDRRISASSLADYTTLVLPGGSLSDENWEAVDQFAQGGGTVVVLGSQAVSVQRRLSSGSTTSSVSVLASGEDDTKEKDRIGSMQQPFDSASNKRALQLISGAIFKTKADSTHPLMFGVGKSDLAVFRNHNRFLKPSSNVYRNPLVYQDEPLLAGYCSDENLKKFADSASVVIERKGRGRFILMADNPNFRGFWHGSRRLFINALLLGDQVD